MIDYTTYNTGENDEILVLELTGRLDEKTATFLFDCVDGHIKHGRTKLILDCSDLEHIVSAGLGTLVRIHFRLKEQGGQVHLVGVQGVVADILRLVHFEKLFHMHDSVDEAVESIS
tara:strand:+ start:118629 stop:118976 length:348 start_codon:yes stop_codon:yes gene_type:complete